MGPTGGLPIDWTVAAVLLAGLAVGAGVAAARASQPVALRAAHATMAVAMLPMLMPTGTQLARLATPVSVIALGAVAIVVARRLQRCPAGWACLVDLIAMAAVLALLASGVRAPIVVLAAAGWAVTSAWVRWEQWVRRNHPLVTWEASSAVVAAGAMAVMAVAMSAG